LKSECKVLKLPNWNWNVAAVREKVNWTWDPRMGSDITSTDSLMLLNLNLIQSFENSKGELPGHCCGPNSASPSVPARSPGSIRSIPPIEGNSTLACKNAFSTSRINPFARTNHIVCNRGAGFDQSSMPLNKSSNHSSCIEISSAIHFTELWFHFSELGNYDGQDI
jgi:hypothetical protein